MLPDLQIVRAPQFLYDIMNIMDIMVTDRAQALSLCHEATAYCENERSLWRHLSFLLSFYREQTLMKRREACLVKFADICVG